MMKRIIALTICLLMMVAALASCAGSIPSDSEYKGQQIIMYLSEDIYDLDPARAYKNESTRAIVSMLFDTLFVLDENGKVKPSLAKDYEIEEKDGSYFMYITIADTYWSDNSPVTADDVAFAWLRLLNPNDNNSFEAASLLYDIKNARLYSQNEVSKEDVRIIADGKRLEIEFEQEIDYDQFLLNLTSLALAPLREDIAGGNEKGPDWAKKPGTMVCSGPFKLSRIAFATSEKTATSPAKTHDDLYYDVKGDLTDSNGNVLKDHKGNTLQGYIPATEVDDFAEQVISSFVLERNAFYYRESEKEEKLDVSVTPYKIIVDCNMSDADVKEAYESGAILYMGTIPFSIRKDYKDEAIVKDSLSTSTLYLNENIKINGKAIFADVNVRRALSMAIDREAIATDLVFAEPATGIVPNGVFDTNSTKKTFRDNSSNDFEYLKTNVDAAKQLLAKSGITPSDYTFTVKYAMYNDEQKYMATEVAKAWSALGFNVTAKECGTIANNDYYKHTDSIPLDICDDLYYQDIVNGEFEVIILDTVAYSADPFSVLAPFAKPFSGNIDKNDYSYSTHLTGFDSKDYDNLMEEIFNEKNIENRSENLHKAEDILMSEMPAIPVVFNKTATLVGEDLNLNNQNIFQKIFQQKKGSNYYNADTLRWATVENYDSYLKACSDFLGKKFDTYKNQPYSYFHAFVDLTYDLFKEESTYYTHLWKEYEQ